MSHEVAPWFPTSEFTGWVTEAGAELLVPAIVALIAWIVLRGMSAIIGEYARRLWFSTWRDELRRTKDEFRLLVADIAAERAQYTAEQRMLERLVLENDRLVLRNIQLSIALSTRDNPIAPPPIDRAPHVFDGPFPMATDAGEAGPGVSPS